MTSPAMSAGGAAGQDKAVSSPRQAEMSRSGGRAGPEPQLIANGGQCDGAGDHGRADYRQELLGGAKKHRRVPSGR